MFNGDELKDVLNGLLFACVAGAGGLISYLSSLFGNRKKFVFWDFVIKGLSSAFAGLVIGWVMLYYQYPVTIISAVTGVGGYLGAIDVAVGGVGELLNHLIHQSDVGG